ncbi:MAG: hypothetical protein IJQ73_18195 [Kiritimatiellae bacterium]|nr:hypothetical protein [Kiritimatiellia bacterium]
MPFLPKYLIAAVLGSIAVYVGSPYLLPYLPGGKTAPSGEAPTEPVWTQAEVDPDEFPEAVASAVAPDADPAGDETPAAEPPDRQTAKPSNRQTVKLSNRQTVKPSNEQTDSQGEPEVIVENVRGYTPSTERIRASGSDVTYWGVTIRDASFYDRDGKLRDDQVPGGTLIEQTAAKRSSKGEMAICRIWRGRNWAGSYLISTADLIRFDGGREEVDADDVDNLCRYYGLSAAVERRKEELVQKAASANPHYRELKAKAKAYNDHMKRAEELTAKRDQAKGAERSRIIAELTQLKNAEAREAAEVQSLTRKYEEWKKNHPSTSGADPSSDPVCKGYLDKMAELKPKLTVFGL